MAEPDTDPPNAMEEEDLEDGEIETDEENDVVMKAPVKAAAAVVAAAAPIEQVKKPKPSDDELKRSAEAKGDNRKSSQDNNTKVKKSTASEIPKGERPLPTFSIHVVLWWTLCMGSTLESRSLMHGFGFSLRLFLFFLCNHFNFY